MYGSGVCWKTVDGEILSEREETIYAFMDMENACDRVNRKGLWEVLTMHGGEGWLLNAVTMFYNRNVACVRIDGECSVRFPVSVLVRQGYVTSPWLFNVHSFPRIAYNQACWCVEISGEYSVANSRILSMDHSELTALVLDFRFRVIY